MTRALLLALLVACGGGHPTATGPGLPDHHGGHDRAAAGVGADNSPGCPADIDHPSADHCDYELACKYPDGTCFCDGYHGGIPPEEGVDYSHIVCARTKGRTDGCPDDLTAGTACSNEGQACDLGQGLACGPLVTCKDGHWVGGRDTCEEIP